MLQGASILVCGGREVYGIGSTMGERRVWAPFTLERRRHLVVLALQGSCRDEGLDCLASSTKTNVGATRCMPTAMATLYLGH